MKNKIKRISNKIKKNKEVQLTQITNNTLEEERKAILSNGRKFKYPVQYSKHKLVVNTLIISAALFLIGSAVLWIQLYIAQNTGSFIYRVSSVLPLPVARVDGQGVKYSDYLLEYRSTMFYANKMRGTLEVSGDEKSLSKLYKNAAMKNAIRNAYAIKLARENDIKVEESEIEKIFKDHRMVGGIEISEKVFNQTIADNYNISPSEYRRIFIELPLLRQKVAVKLDAKAQKTKDEVVDFLKSNNNDFAKIKETFGDSVESGSTGVVKTSNIDGGRTEAALKLEVGQVSEPFVSKTGDGYFIVKLLSKNEKELSYEYIKIPFTELSSKIEELEKSGKITKHIKIEE